MKVREILLPSLAVILAAAFLGAAAAVLYVAHDNSSPDTVLGQPKRERAAQRDLPSSDDPVWPTLRTTKVVEDKERGLFTASYPPAVTQLNGRDLTVAGFMLPLESREASTHFLLSHSTPVCFFCPPGEPNEIIEVRSAAPVPYTTDEVRVSGRFRIQGQGTDGLFFHLDGASAE